MTTVNDWWNWTLSSSILPQALVEAAHVVWSEHATPVSQVLTRQGTLANEISWLPACSFHTNNSAMSYALVMQLPPSLSCFYSTILQLGNHTTNQVTVFSTVEQILWGAPSALGNLALSQNPQGDFIRNTDIQKPFHLGSFSLCMPFLPPLFLFAVFSYTVPKLFLA